MTCFLLSKCRPGYVTFCGYVYYNKINEAVGYKRIYMDADAQTFRVDAHWPEYGMDKKHAYFLGRQISGSDGMTFEILQGGYQKDKNHVYFRNYIIPNADPSSFKDAPTEESGHEYIRFAEDQNDFYYCATPLGIKDKKQFRQWYVNGYLWGLDAKYCYCQNNICEINDYKSFKVLDSGLYAKDDVHVYFLGKVVEGADPISFKETDIFRGEDINGKYDLGHRIQDHTLR